MNIKHMSDERIQSVTRNALEIARDHFKKLVDDLTANADAYDAMTDEDRAEYHKDPPNGPNGERYVNCAPTGRGMRAMAQMFSEQGEPIEALLKRYSDYEGDDERCIACDKELE